MNNRRLASGMVTICVLSAGCAMQKAAPRAATLTTPPPEAAKNAHPQSHGLEVVTDPCANRLDTIAGDLLLYVAINHRLPAKLEDMQAAQPSDAKIEITCPITREPYVYSTRGLQIPGMPGRLIVYDASAAHAETRWGILMQPSAAGGAPQLDIVHMDRVQFARYLPSPDM